MVHRFPLSRRRLSLIASAAVLAFPLSARAQVANSYGGPSNSDPCFSGAKVSQPISTALGTTALAAGVAGKRTYVCSLMLVVASAVSVSLAEGSSSTCGGSSQAAVIGVATSGVAANGLSLLANGGFSLGNGGATVASTATAANYLCLFQSGTAQISGVMTYVQQ